MSCVTRFAPSPTGALHLGGARTAFFNWLFAQKHGGQFLLRVEDTDKARSSKEALSSILDGLAWLGLQHEGTPFFQSKQQARHQEVAHQLLKAGHAYWCDAPAQVPAHKRGAPSVETQEGEAGAKKTGPVLRFKIKRDGTTGFHDLTQGAVGAKGDSLNDFVLLRSDGSPTYMLAVVVDDHDMGITHVIRGVDHLTNAYHQVQLYQALGWKLPCFAHIPLIHGPDGAKLSKRHGALDINAYKESGFLKEAMLNALLRLGWGHGDQEIFSTQQAIGLFDLKDVSRAPARFDPKKLLALNGHYMRQMTPEVLLEALQPFMKETPDEAFKGRLLKGLQALAQRAETLQELARKAAIYQDTPVVLEEKAAKILTSAVLDTLALYVKMLKAHTEWTHEALEAATRAFAAQQDVGLGKIAQPLRAALTGSTVSPPLFEVMEVLGQDLTCQRLEHVLP
ncbi:MAG: glutamate--tRNA ligase [Holosporaceae bacterium]